MYTASTPYHRLDSICTALFLVLQVMAVDSSPAPNSHLLASVSYDRTVKLWAPEGMEEGSLGHGPENMEL